jgi:hypothetical protein
MSLCQDFKYDSETIIHVYRLADSFTVDCWEKFYKAHFPPHATDWLFKTADIIISFYLSIENIYNYNC